MRLLVLQHVPFEGPASIKEWADSKNFAIAYINCADCVDYPSHESYDFLIVLGGPMSVNDPLSWLQPEKTFISDAIRHDKYILGICLGAQLIASCLGAEVRKHNQREIGWFPVRKLDDSECLDFPRLFTPLHWHGDTFDIPVGATHLYASDACDNQAYLYNRRVIGLQFHLEFDVATATRVGEACPDELADKGKYVSSLHEIISDQNRFKEANSLMAGLLDHIHRRWQSN